MSGSRPSYLSTFPTLEKEILTLSSLANVSHTADPMKCVSLSCRGEEQSRRRAHFLFLFCFFLLIGKTICPNLQRAASRHLASIHSHKRAHRPLASTHTHMRVCVCLCSAHPAVNVPCHQTEKGSLPMSGAFENTG